MFEKEHLNCKKRPEKAKVITYGKRKEEKMKSQTRWIIWSITLALVLALSGGSIPTQAGAQKDETREFSSANIPVTVFPSSVIPIKKIIYIWTAVPDAAQYQVQVYQNSVLKLNKIFSSSVCGAGTCSVRPGILLANGTYAWRVRAIIDGANQPFSAWQSFTVNVPSAGFYSPFTTNANGWTVHNGTWILESSNYFTTTGLAGKAVTISHTGTYSTMAYQARMKRDGCAGCANVLAIRGNPVLDATGWWNTEYTFDYTNTGLFSVWKDSYGTYTALKNWTYTNAINQGGWNTLLVTAENTALKFYINGILVWSGSDASYSSGMVGIGMYRSAASTGDKLWVDWAELNPSIMVGLPESSDIGEEVEGGDKNMAP